MITPPNGGSRVLLVGYNGANNTGAEALLQADIEDVRALMGPDVTITVPSLSEANLRRYLREGPHLRIERMPTVFPLKTRQLVRQHDIVMLVEGSAYMDSWTSALLWYFLWATRCAHEAGKPSLAYAVDAGTLSPGNQRLVRREASKTDFIVTRSQAAADRLRAWGVTAPIEVTADNALNFVPNPDDAGFLARTWPEADGVVGMALVDFHQWPVVARPWGRARDCYKWPYYYSRSPERTRATEALARGYAALADRVILEHGKSVALICMEELDEPFARQVQAYMSRAARSRIYSSRQHNASQMTTLLRSLDALVTSRYHACVLSLAAQVPQVAAGHDLRLKTIYQELGLAEDYFVDPNGADTWTRLSDRVDRLLADPRPMRQALLPGYEEHLAAAKRNRGLLERFLEEHR
ncbi:MAG: polysaccharide pyruvyl transferase family protein [Anaerolineae bacterium]